MSLEISYPVSLLINSLRAKASESRAVKSAAYMKGQFPFLGVTAPERMELMRDFLQTHGKPGKAEWETVIRQLWEQPEREFQYLAQDLLARYKSQYREEHLAWFEQLITEHSWWDTVDHLASHCVGAYFLNYPEKRYPAIDRWMQGDDLWLKRTALIFQLKYKDKTDAVLLGQLITDLMHEKDFFIRKAIGWSLRQYSKFNPGFVRDFVEEHEAELSGLSKKEALRLL